MLVYVAVEEQHIKRLEDIEKKYLHLIHQRPSNEPAEPESEQEGHRLAEEAEGRGLYFDAENEVDKPTSVEEDLKKIPQSTASVQKSLSKDDSLTLQHLIPFIPKKYHHKAQKFLKALQESNIKISSSGQVFFNDKSYKDLNGIQMIRQVLSPKKNSPPGTQLFENFLVEEGLGSFIAPYTTKSRIKGSDSLPKAWYFAGDS